MPISGYPLALGVALLLLPSSLAFYLPGSAPRDYKVDDPVDLWVNRLVPSSDSQTKLKSLINYDYYHPAFHFCTPQGGVQAESTSIGSIIFGDRIFNSPFQINMLQNSTCSQLCTATIPSEDAKFINERIKEDYALNWLVDGLPAAEMKEDMKTHEVFYDIGFALGGWEGKEDGVDPEIGGPLVLNNHYEIMLSYHRRSDGKYRVVGVLVWPMSNAPRSDGTPVCEGPRSASPLQLNENANNQIPFTYSVRWNESATPWATRWDNYLHIFDPRIHWFSIINSIVIVIFLCGMVSMILYKTVSRDIVRYNSMDLNEDVQEDYGWKLVWGEVFRAPRQSMTLSVLVGNGCQLITMVGVTLVFALLGFLSPSNRGSIATVMLVCWTLFGFISGYMATRVYTSLGGTADHRKLAFFTAFLLPTFVFVAIFLLNLFLVAAGSSGAVPFGTIVFVVLLWFVINAPLTFVGSWIGQKHGGVRHPVRVNQIPRQIPPGPKYLRPWTAALLAGLLPFGAAFVELYFVLSSLFASRAYYAFGFLSMTACVVCLTTGTVTILFTYFILCAEEYRWHWRAFLTGGGSAFWLLAYGLFYWIQRLSLDSFTSVVLYMGYLFLLTILEFLITGTIGFLASYWAMRKLYGAIRVD